jgi:hypothetical protein
MPARPLPVFLTLSALTALLLCAGCAAGETAQRVTIAGGAQVMLPFDRGNVRPAREGNLESRARFEFDKAAKTYTYLFELLEAQGRVPRRIRVDDVTETDVVPLVDDAAPAFGAGGHVWAKRILCGASDPRIAWLRTIGNSTRVYRYTVETADGRTVVLMQGVFYPGVIKSGLRQVVFSENY